MSPNKSDNTCLCIAKYPLCLCLRTKPGEMMFVREPLLFSCRRILPSFFHPLQFTFTFLYASLQPFPPKFYPLVSTMTFYFISAGYRVTQTNVVCPCNIFRFFVRFSMWRRAWLTCRTITTKSMPPCNQRHNSPGGQQILVLQGFWRISVN